LLLSSEQNSSRAASAAQLAKCILLNAQ